MVRVFSAVLVQRNRDQSSADQIEAQFCQFLFIIDLLSAVEICSLCRVLNINFLESPPPRILPGRKSFVVALGRLRKEARVMYSVCRMLSGLF